jgi:hypothetical protein
MSIARRGDLRVILTRAQRVAAPHELAAHAHDDTADPRIVPGGPPRQLPFFDCEAHPPLLLVVHRVRSITHRNEDGYPMPARDEAIVARERSLRTTRPNVPAV